MIPETLLGVLLLIGSIGPGYVWIRVSELRRPQQQRSTLVETAELAVVGFGCTAVAALVVLAVADRVERLRIDLPAAEADFGAYVATEPVRAIGTVIAVFGFAHLLALVGARLRHRGETTLVPGYSVWDQVFELADRSVRVFAETELRDGRRFTGFVHTWDVGSTEDRRDLALYAPITVAAPGRDPVDLDEQFHFVTLREEDLVWIAISQAPSPFEKGSVAA